MTQSGMEYIITVYVNTVKDTWTAIFPAHLKRRMWADCKLPHFSITASHVILFQG